MQTSYEPATFLRELHSQSDSKTHQEYISVIRSIFCSPNPLHKRGTVKTVQPREKARFHLPIPQRPMVAMGKEVANTTFHPGTESPHICSTKAIWPTTRACTKQAMNLRHCVSPLFFWRRVFMVVLFPILHSQKVMTLSRE